MRCHWRCFQMLVCASQAAIAASFTISHRCGAKPIVENLYVPSTNLLAGGRRTLLQGNYRRSIVIPLTFRSFGPSTCTSESSCPLHLWVDQHRIDLQMQALNKAFEPVGVTFRVSSISHYADDHLLRMAQDNIIDLDSGWPRWDIFGDRWQEGTIFIYILPLTAYLGIAAFPQPGLFRARGIYLAHAALSHKVADSTTSQYGLGNTLVHEMGHYFGLLHTFQGGCDPPGDGVADTSYELGPNYGSCFFSRDSCLFHPGSDPITNFMDYSDDSCTDTFTAGQVDRMQWMLAAHMPELWQGAVAGGCSIGYAPTGPNGTCAPCPPGSYSESIGDLSPCQQCLAPGGELVPLHLSLSHGSISESACLSVPVYSTRGQRICTLGAASHCFASPECGYHLTTPLDVICGGAESAPKWEDPNWFCSPDAVAKEAYEGQGTTSPLQESTCTSLHDSFLFRHTRCGHSDCRGSDLWSWCQDHHEGQQACFFQRFYIPAMDLQGVPQGITTADQCMRCHAGLWVTWLWRRDGTASTRTSAAICGGRGAWWLEGRHQHVGSAATGHTFYPHYRCYALGHGIGLGYPAQQLFEHVVDHPFGVQVDVAHTALHEGARKACSADTCDHSSHRRLCPRACQVGPAPWEPCEWHPCTPSAPVRQADACADTAAASASQRAPSLHWLACSRLPERPAPTQATVDYRCNTTLCAT